MFGRSTGGGCGHGAKDAIVASVFVVGVDFFHLHWSDGRACHGSHTCIVVVAVAAVATFATAVVVVAAAVAVAAVVVAIIKNWSRSE